MIEFKNKRTRCGAPFRIYATDCGGAYPIHGAVYEEGQWKVLIWTKDFKFYKNANSHEFDLIDHNPYEGFKIDDKVVVWNFIENKERAHFAGTAQDGRALTFDRGATSFTDKGFPKHIWDNCKLAEVDS